jgi:hypothetical protein
LNGVPAFPPLHARVYKCTAWCELLRSAVFRLAWARVEVLFHQALLVVVGCSVLRSEYVEAALARSGLSRQNWISCTCLSDKSNDYTELKSFPIVRLTLADKVLVAVNTPKDLVLVELLSEVNPCLLGNCKLT